MKKYKLNLDLARLVAAILVVAIHTQPFHQGLPFVGYLFNTVLARLAVPFFFLLSGYFLLNKDARALKDYLLEILKLYGLSCLLYLGVWIFTHKGFPVGEFFLDLVYLGLHYHLWYFLALILGSILIFGLLRAFPLKTTFWICFGLYLFGSFGNVYVSFLPGFLQGFYSGLVTTRNGVFFAPIFLLLGYLLHQPIRFNKRVLGISLALYGLETCLFYLLAQWQKVEITTQSMFISLVPLTYLLGLWLVRQPSKVHESPWFHRLSLYIYIVHPLVITLWVGLAKALNRTANGTLMFIGTTLLSLLISYLYMRVKPLFLPFVKNLIKKRANQNNPEA